ncbi:hypothetical protein [Corynebacterium mustelae]|nr:hypothetical protein [Corynebacterium mustelae]
MFSNTFRTKNRAIGYVEARARRVTVLGEHQLDLFTSWAAESAEG